METDCRVWRTWLDSTEWLDRTPFFLVSCTSFYIHSLLLTFFLCFIVLFKSCCSHAQVFGKTLGNEFPIYYSHTEWNLLSRGTNTLLWWRACYQITNYKQTKIILGTSWRTVVSDWRNWTRLSDWTGLLFPCQLYLFPHLFSSSYLLPLFHYLIWILLFPCAGVFENTRPWVPHFL